MMFQNNVNASAHRAAVDNYFRTFAHNLLACGSYVSCVWFFALWGEKPYTNKQKSNI